MANSVTFDSSYITSEHSIIQFSQDDDQPVAVKKLRIQNLHTITRWRNEVDILKIIQGPDYVSLLLSSNPQAFTLTLRRETGQSLDKYINNTTRRCTLTKPAATTLWQDITRALIHIHSHSIIHDDVKPENIMWDAPRIHAVLIDFGAAYASKEHGKWVFNPSGTPSYVAPEFLERRKSCASDVWALGTTMLFAKRLVSLPMGEWFLPRVFEDGKDREKLLKWWREVEVVRGRLGVGEDEEDRGEDEKVLARMLEKDVDKRITSAELAIALGVQQGQSQSLSRREEKV